MYTFHAITFATWVSLAVAQQQPQIRQQEGYQGFSSGATLDGQTAKQESDFAEEFRVAQNLHGSPGTFNSVRLYTNIQAETTDTPSAAFKAAIDTKTSMLLGLWCSGTDTIESELTALSSAIKTYGQEFADLVVGISVGSEDLYRISESGIRNDAGLGNGPKEIIGFINEVRDAIADTPLKDVPVGHVDTSSAFFNESNAEVIKNCDFIGMDAYPFYEREKDNTFENARNLWDTAYRKTLAAAGDVPVWITEVGWPSEGPDFGKAVASVDNARAYWQDLGCDLFGRTNTWWYSLHDTNPDIDEDFSITKDLSTTPIFDLSCPVDAKAPKPVNTGGSSNSTGTTEDDEDAASFQNAPSFFFSLGMVILLSVFVSVGIM
jgi:glucan endo-1,3-beta-D-glucosidase